MHSRALSRRCDFGVALLSLIGLADAITASYLVLFASGDLWLVPPQIGFVTTAAALSGIALTSIAGRWID